MDLSPFVGEPEKLMSVYALIFSAKTLLFSHSNIEDLLNTTTSIIQ